MKVIRTECDNPPCPSDAVPESTHEPYIPPFGWLRVSADFVTTGPSVEIEVCSIECLAEAVAAAMHEQRSKPWA